MRGRAYKFCWHHKCLSRSLKDFFQRLRLRLFLANFFGVITCVHSSHEGGDYGVRTVGGRRSLGGDNFSKWGDKKMRLKTWRGPYM